MVGLAAEKKKKDLARMASPTQINMMGMYTVLKDQYSQCNNLIKNGR
jgi:hypothetical protein